ncbi:hypothetical protein NN561_013053 [Cricetulus griseus]
MLLKITRGLTLVGRAGSSPRRPQPEWRLAAGERGQHARPRGPGNPGRSTYVEPPGCQGCRSGRQQVWRWPAAEAPSIPPASGRTPGRCPAPAMRLVLRPGRRLRPLRRASPATPLRSLAPSPEGEPPHQRRCAPHLPRSLRRLRRSACSSRWPAAHGQGRSEPGAQRPCRGARRLKRRRPAGASHPLPQNARRSARREPLAAGLVLAPEAV